MEDSLLHPATVPHLAWLHLRPVVTSPGLSGVPLLPLAFPQRALRATALVHNETLQQRSQHYGNQKSVLIPVLEAAKSLRPCLVRPFCCVTIWPRAVCTTHKHTPQTCTHRHIHIHTQKHREHTQTNIHTWTNRHSRRDTHRTNTQ